MAKATDIETELREAFDVHPKTNEARQKFLVRLMTAAKTCPEKEWDKLTTPTQKWVNLAIDADDENKDLPDPTPEGGSTSSNRDAKDETDMAKKAAAAKKGGETGTKGAAKDTDKKDETKGGRAPARGAREEKDPPKRGATTAPAKKPAASAEKKGKSNRRLIKEMVVRKPGVGLDVLVEKFGGKGGMSNLSISSIRSDTLDTLKVADAAGFWKGGALSAKD